MARSGKNNHSSLNEIEMLLFQILSENQQLLDHKENFAAASWRKKIKSTEASTSSPLLIHDS